jgi:hypothetical protein
MSFALTFDEHLNNVIEELMEEAADENFAEHDLWMFFEAYADVFTPDVVAGLMDSEDPDEQYAAASAALWLDDPAWIPDLCALYRTADDDTVIEQARWAVTRYDETVLIWNDFWDALAQYAEAQMPPPGTLIQMSMF